MASSVLFSLLQTHLAQVENEYKEKLEIEASARKEVEKVLQCAC